MSVEELKRAVQISPRFIEAMCNLPDGALAGSDPPFIQPTLK
jgi:hypothetical protein